MKSYFYFIITCLSLLSCNKSENEKYTIIDQSQNKKNKVVSAPVKLKEGECFYLKENIDNEEKKEEWQIKPPLAQYRIETLGKYSYLARSLEEESTGFYHPDTTISFDSPGIIKISCPDYMSRIPLKKDVSAGELAFFKVGDCLSSINQTQDDVMVIAIVNDEYTVTNDFSNKKKNQGYTLKIFQADKNFTKVSCSDKK